MFKNVQADLVPAVREMISESLTGWADSLMVEVQRVDPAYRAGVKTVDKRTPIGPKLNGKQEYKQNTITLRQLNREIKKVDAEAAKRDIKMQAQSEQARRAELYTEQSKFGGEISYEPDIDELFMNQLKFAAILVQECGFDPEYFTEDE